MFKLVVLSALLAAAVASPGAILGTPLAYTSTIVSPGTTTITNQASSVIHPSPLGYYAPVTYSAIPAYTHLIKKRSVALGVNTYIAPSTYLARTPFVTTYTAAAPLTTTYAAAPIATTYGAPLIRTSPYYTAAHLIKKRSAPLFVPTTYIAPTTYAATPLISSYSAATPFVSAPVISHAGPIATISHYIKKR